MSPITFFQYRFRPRSCAPLGLGLLTGMAVAALGCGPKSPAHSTSLASTDVSAPAEADKTAGADNGVPSAGQAADQIAYPADRALDISVLARHAYAEQVQRASLQIDRGKLGAAQDSLKDIGATVPAAAYLRAQLHLAAKEYQRAGAALALAQTDDKLADLVALSRGAVLAAQGEATAAIALLEPYLERSGPLAMRAAAHLGPLWIEHDAAAFVAHAARLQQLLDPTVADARAQLWRQHRTALTTLGRAEEAQAVALRLYIEEPLSRLSPEKPPRSLTPAEALRRGERILELHRNRRAIEALTAVADATLQAEEKCRRNFGLGLAHRKLHHYTTAEKHLTWVGKQCSDETLRRRAHYLLAKVVSIKSGLRSVPIIEDFAKKFSEHSMVDDVLFWAGDLYQRRSRHKEASLYYRRIVDLPQKGDHCADAQWRIAWMAYRQGKMERFKALLEGGLQDRDCSGEPFDRARLGFWLARVAQLQRQPAAAADQYAAVIAAAPLSFYAQLAARRLSEVAAADGPASGSKFLLPQGNAMPALCPGPVAAEPGFQRAMDYVVRGLGAEAAAELRALATPEQRVVSKSHAVSQGVEVQAAVDQAGGEAQALPAKTCGADDAPLLVTLLLNRAGAFREAQWRLRTEFSATLDSLPSEKNIGMFKAAYPLAYRAELAAAEQEQKLPAMMLQALAREESAFDAEVVSWAGAYGLTQVLMRTGKSAGAMLKPPVVIRSEAQLLDPALNARLGGVFLNSLLRRYQNNFALALVAYNASDTFAKTLWSRHRSHTFERFCEEVTIRETRGYLKRVLKTYGIYRWLYGVEAQPLLPIALTLPPMSL